MNNLESSNLPLICAKFDPTYPVTRYFKDTVKYLDIHEKKEKAHKVIPEIWEVKDNQSREESVARGISEKLIQNSSSKFIIFVRYRHEADNLKKAIIAYESSKIQTKDIKIIFADAKDSLQEYSKIRPGTA